VTSDDQPRPQEEQAPPVLPYADLPARWGVAIIRDGDRLRVIVPPLGSWRQLSKAIFISSAILAFFGSLFAYMAIEQRSLEPVPDMIFCALVVFILMAVAFYRLHRRVILDLTAPELVVRTIVPLLSPTARRWPRADVTEIKRNPSSGKLLIRIRGQDFVEFYLGRDEEMTEHIGEVLREELRRPSAVLGRLVQGEHERVAATRRRQLIAATFVMLFVAVALMFLGFPWAIFGYYLLLLSGAPAGMALGTQEKDYYFF